ncbi:MAG: hypothetical protein ACLQRM_16165 [Acidimicrobiales bacterium]
MRALLSRQGARTSTEEFFIGPVESSRRTKRFALSRVLPAVLVAIGCLALVLPSTGASPSGPATLYGQYSNGLPTSSSFFPIGVWFQNPAGGDVPAPYTNQAQAFKAMGINVFVGISQENGVAWPESYGADQGELAAAANAGVYVIGGGDPNCTQDNTGGDPCDTDHASVASVKQLLASLPAADQKYFVGYEWTDEPPCNMNITSQVAAISAEDPTRMTYANEGAWVADLPGNDIGSPSGSGLTTTQCLSDAETNLVATSIASSDDYALTDPWHTSTCAGANCTYLYGVSAANMRALAGPTKPVWAFIESGTDDLGLSTQNGACNWTSNLCASGNEAAATPVQVNSAAWDAIINGANGIEWFCDASDIGSTGTTNSGTTAYDACAGGAGDGSPVGGSTIIPANLTYIDNTVESYAPELNSPDLSGMEVSTSNPSVPVVDMLKQVGDDDYLFVESDRDGATTATYSDPALSGLTATLVYDSANQYDPANSEQGMTFTFSGTGTFSDTLGTTNNPYQVKIYAIAGAGSTDPSTTTTTDPPTTTTTIPVTTTTVPPVTTTTLPPVTTTTIPVTTTTAPPVTTTTIPVTTTTLPPVTTTTVPPVTTTTVPQVTTTTVPAPTVTVPTTLPVTTTTLPAPTVVVTTTTVPPVTTTTVPAPTVVVTTTTIPAPTTATQPPSTVRPARHLHLPPVLPIRDLVFSLHFKP